MSKNILLTAIFVGLLPIAAIAGESSFESSLNKAQQNFASKKFNDNKIYLCARWRSPTSTKQTQKKHKQTNPKQGNSTQDFNPPLIVR